MGQGAVQCGVAAKSVAEHCVAGSFAVWWGNSSKCCGTVAGQGASSVAGHWQGAPEAAA